MSIYALYCPSYLLSMNLFFFFFFGGGGGGELGLNHNIVFVILKV